MRIAATLLAVLLWGPLGPLAALHDPTDDPTCAPPSQLGADRLPSVEPVYECVDAEHCVVCHWLNGFRILAAVPVLLDAGAAPVGAVPVLRVAVGDRPVGLRLPGRSPPPARRHV